TYARAGHLPPLLVEPGRPPRRLTAAGGPPLGTGPLTLDEESVELQPGAVVALYTDGLVERRDADIDAGIDALAERLRRPPPALEELPDALVEVLLPEGPDDDVAMLLARVPLDEPAQRSVRWPVEPQRTAVQDAREACARTLAEWGIVGELASDVVLVVSELVTNAVMHGRAPISLHMRATSHQLVLQAEDAESYLPRKLRPTLDDEHGRGLQVVALLAERWGARPTPTGKCVWCVFPLARGRASAPSPPRRARPGMERSPADAPMTPADRSGA
ncbi:MAG TPA: ATP-binding SpoIIE family protein phosphatase, partial [Acidimicrobiales bacterium]|nr:ATP-binding SpoIIE family protein phosphatase [Acidimicrobiales bacterium]